MDPYLDRLKIIEEKIEHIERTVVKIRTVQRTTATVRALYWVFIILLGLGAFYFVQPYLQQLQNMYGAIGTDSQNFKELLDQLTGEDR